MGLAGSDSGTVRQRAAWFSFYAEVTPRGDCEETGRTGVKSLETARGRGWGAVGGRGDPDACRPSRWGDRTDLRGTEKSPCGGETGSCTE